MCVHSWGGAKWSVICLVFDIKATLLNLLKCLIVCSRYCTSPLLYVEVKSDALIDYIQNTIFGFGLLPCKKGIQFCGGHQDGQDWKSCTGMTKCGTETCSTWRRGGLWVTYQLCRRSNETLYSGEWWEMMDMSWNKKELVCKEKLSNRKAERLCSLHPWWFCPDCIKLSNMTRSCRVWPLILPGIEQQVRLGISWAPFQLKLSHDLYKMLIKLTFLLKYKICSDWLSHKNLSGYIHAHKNV